MSLGGGVWEGGGLKVSPPPYDIFVKGYPILEKNGISEEILYFFG
jgi:hypothetical protein